MDENLRPNLRLGDPVDLLSGLKPAFVAPELPWHRPAGTPVVSETAPVPAGPARWDPPVLSLHDSVEDLLSHVFDYSVAPMVGLDGPLSVCAGSLMAGQDLSDLEARLGLDLSLRPAHAHLLVRLGGRRGTATHTQEWLGLNRKVRILQWLTPEGRAAMARLRLREMRREGAELHGDVTARQAGRYLAYFEDFGTHVVRSITYGERLFQLFEVSGDLLASLRRVFAEAPRPFCGPAAFAMAHLTRSPWTAKASPILSVGDCDIARRVTRHAIWASGSPGDPPSLLSRGAVVPANLETVLAELPARSITAVGFACQALFMEDHRADAWARLMRGSLCQRFPGLRQVGWRERGSFRPQAFLKSARLSGDEALSKPALPSLPEIAFALDVTASGRLADPVPPCLALFAATDPGTGCAAWLESGASVAFDPSRLTIPFLDGALSVTSGDGRRWCLVESAWIGGDGAPGVVADPATPSEDLLIRFRPQLSAYLRLVARLQTPLFPTDVAAAMRRCAVWLAEVTAVHPALATLRLQALAVARGLGRHDPRQLTLGDEHLADLAALLRLAAALSGLHPDGDDLRPASQQQDLRLRAFHRRLPEYFPPAALAERVAAAAKALCRSFAGLAGAPDLPDHARRLFRAGAGLAGPPDPRVLPHGLMPGEAPYPLLWNALLGLRARHAGLRAVLLAGEDRLGEAAEILSREPIGAADAPPDPAADAASALAALADDLRGCDAAVIARLPGEIAELVAASRSAGLLWRADDLALSGSPTAEVGPQLHRLLVVLETLDLACLAGLPLAPLASLAPDLLAARINDALTALARHPARA
ncbi:hypothetical protein [Aurantimonas sp. 22II-16-19i]|uniref:hypothetical protein n=1 Tax=Aurantimonas sp. 22II-16-19i TaxID=1317114 RepID=UPI0009F7E079|nr:hypothetical protein [Aurantimonas sp. 22II-16-19i]ORE92723.1 hypothetical protein ATO4_16890 [Aurantimonas sp. 22II-16-19i]